MEYALPEVFFLLALRDLHVSAPALGAGSFGINVFCLEDFDRATVPLRATDGVEMPVVEPNARAQ